MDNSTDNSTDFTSDEASIIFIHRTLCPRHPFPRLRHDETTKRPQRKKREYDYPRSKTMYPSSESLNINTTTTTTSISEILPLPPLTSSNAVDVQLYAVLATLVQAFVLPWYRFGSGGMFGGAEGSSGVDPGEEEGEEEDDDDGHGRDAKGSENGTGGPDTDDRNGKADGNVHGNVDHLIAEIVRLVAHCSRGLEERLRRVDAMALLLDEVPAVVERHVVAYRTANEPLHPTLFTPERHQLYHALNPHPALSPVVSAKSSSHSPLTEVAEQQAENDAAWRYLLAEGVVSVLLPSEDLQNGCLRTLLTETLADLVLGRFVGGVVSEPAFIWDGIAKAADLIAGAGADAGGRTRGREEEEQRRVMSASGNLEKYGLLDPVRLDEDEQRSKGEAAVGGMLLAQVSRYFWLGLYITYVFYIIVRTVVVVLATSSSLPHRSRLKHGSKEDDGVHKCLGNVKRSDISNSVSTSINDRLCPIVEMRVWACLGRLLDVDRLMPWTGGLAALGQWMAVHGLGRVGRVDGLLDRILASCFRRVVLHQGAAQAAQAAQAAKVVAPALAPANANTSGDAIGNAIGNAKAGAATTATATATATSTPAEHILTSVLRSLRRTTMPDNTITLATPTPTNTTNAAATTNTYSTNNAITIAQHELYNHHNTNTNTNKNNSNDDENANANANNKARLRCANALLALLPSSSILPAFYYGISVRATPNEHELDKGQDEHGHEYEHEHELEDTATASFSTARQRHHNNNNNNKKAMIHALDAHTLGLFDDAYMNRHLLYGLVEVLVLTLLPELADGH